jgi:hypothetical protein
VREFDFNQYRSVQRIWHIKFAQYFYVFLKFPDRPYVSLLGENSCRRAGRNLDPSELGKGHTEPPLADRNSWGGSVQRLDNATIPRPVSQAG